MKEKLLKAWVAIDKATDTIIEILRELFQLIYIVSMAIVSIWYYESMNFGHMFAALLLGFVILNEKLNRIIDKDKEQMRAVEKIINDHLLKKDKENSDS